MHGLPDAPGKGIYILKGVWVGGLGQGAEKPVQAVFQIGHAVAGGDTDATADIQVANCHTGVCFKRMYELERFFGKAAMRACILGVADGAEMDHVQFKPFGVLLYPSASLHGFAGFNFQPELGLGNKTQPDTHAGFSVQSSGGRYNPVNFGKAVNIDGENVAFNGTGYAFVGFVHAIEDDLFARHIELLSEPELIGGYDFSADAGAVNLVQDSGYAVGFVRIDDFGVRTCLFGCIVDGVGVFN